MCGIAGYFAPGKNYNAELRTMTNVLAHRGPDADGFFFDDTVGLGHRRLSIIDLSEEANQPMFSRDNQHVIIYNGEVFNFREIAKELHIPLRTHSDTEVIIESLVKWDVNSVHRFNGMFAFAFYDLQKKKLLLFRDRIGVKPLYYIRLNDEWWFASELKALLSNQRIQKTLTLNHQAISYFLQLGYIPGPHTIWNEIQKLPAGSYLKIKSSGCSIETYWKPEDKIQLETLKDESVAMNELGNLLRSSVKMRMISDVPFGAFLSGGIDSSLVAAFAQRESTQPVKTFSIGFKDAKFNEATYAAKIARHLGTDHEEYYVTEQDALELLEEMLDLYDEPFADSSGLPTMLISKLARSKVKMVLTGDGGDELFMGYGSYLWAQRLSNPVFRMLRKPIAAVLSVGSSRYKRVAELFRFARADELPQHIFSQEQYFFSQSESQKLLNELRQEEMLGNINSGRKLSAAEYQSLFDINYYLRDDLLVKVDRASMHYSLECRTPFLDYRIVEFALNLSQELKMQNGKLKLLPKQLLANIVPLKLFDRPKQGFAIPLCKWLQTHLNHLIGKYLSEDVLTRHHIVRVKEVEQLKRNFIKGTDYLYNRIWNLLVLHRWMEKNLNH